MVKIAVVMSNFKVDVGELDRLEEPIVTRVSVEKRVLDDMMEELYRISRVSEDEPQYSKEEYLKQLHIVPVQWVTHSRMVEVLIPTPAAPHAADDGEGTAPRRSKRMRTPRSCSPVSD